MKINTELTAMEIDIPKFILLCLSIQIIFFISLIGSSLLSIMLRFLITPCRVATLVSKRTSERFQIIGQHWISSLTEMSNTDSSSNLFVGTLHPLPTLSCHWDFTATCCWLNLPLQEIRTVCGVAEYIMKVLNWNDQVVKNCLILTFYKWLAQIDWLLSFIYFFNWMAHAIWP